MPADHHAELVTVRQRYKGLREMSPAQLWETMMRITVRCGYIEMILLRVANSDVLELSFSLVF